MNNITIERTNLATLERPYIIAEIAQSHDGSLGMAKAFIDLAKECGADAVKFQTHIANQESTSREPWRVKFSHQDSTRLDYWKRMEFTFEQWEILKGHAQNVGIDFISSCFSVMACQWMKKLGMNTWKIASGEAHNQELLDWIASTGDTVILSSGLSETKETDQIIQYMQKKNSPIILLHCTTKYPTPPEQIGMNVFEQYKRDYNNILFGLSDHSGKIYPSIVASYLGASVIEAHLTFHSGMFGPDVPASLAPQEFSAMVDGVKFAAAMARNPVDKTEQVTELSGIRSIFTRSLVANKDINVGEVITEEKIGYKKPGGGLQYHQRSLIIGKLAKRIIKVDEPFSEEDF